MWVSQVVPKVKGEAVLSERERPSTPQSESAGVDGGYRQPLVEQAVATLKAWRLLRKLRCSPAALRHEPRPSRPPSAAERLRLRMEKLGIALQLARIVISNDSGPIKVDY